MRCSSLHSLLAFAATILLSPHGVVASADTADGIDLGHSSHAAVRRRAAASCNGSPALCDRRYDSVTHMGAHNSAFVRDASTNNSIAANQYFPATRALDDGIRLLQAQTHNLGGAIELCHSLCALLDAGPLEKWLGGIKAWLDGHAEEVVTLLLVNGDGFKAADFGKVFDAAGLSSYGYVPSSSSPSSSPVTWPTLGDMISTNKRLVVFIESISPSPAYPFLLSEFDHVFETPYAVTTSAGFNCTLDRPQQSAVSSAAASAAIKAGKLSLMNHFKYNTIGTGAGAIMYPASQDVADTNSPAVDAGAKGSLGAHADRCVAEWDGRRPTFVLVDFYSEGPAMGTGDRLNGINRGINGGGAQGQASSTSSSTSSSTTTTTTMATTTTAAGSAGGAGGRLGQENGVAFGLVVFLVGVLIMV